MSNYLTTAQTADWLGISPARVRKLIQEGRLPAEKPGRDYVMRQREVEAFAKNGRKNIGRPKQNTGAGVIEVRNTDEASPVKPFRLGQGLLYTGDALRILPKLARGIAQVVIADPPYFQVLDESWDNKWRSQDDYLAFTVRWVRECRRLLRTDGILYVFGQLGKREHIWLHACSLLAKEMQFHDMIVWDRAVGYNERYDSFTPQYEMILALRQTDNDTPYFNKDAVRLPYPEEKIKTYLRDKRYKDKRAREQHLRAGKYATNILRVPSLKGSSKEKVGHPSQKPVALINHLIRSSSAEGDWVLDPFLGSGTTAEAAETNNRRWIGIEQDKGYVAIAKERLGSARPQRELSLD